MHEGDTRLIEGKKILKNSLWIDTELFLMYHLYYYFHTNCSLSISGECLVPGIQRKV